MTELFVPGRLCLLGEHTDWAAGKHRLANSDIPKGYCLVCATNEGLFGRVEEFPRENHLRYEHVNAAGLVSSIDVDLGEPDKLLEGARAGGFFAYVYGTVHHMLPLLRQALSSLPSPSSALRGVKICNFKTTLPLKKGLSSSAAVCVLVVKALSMHYDLCLDRDAVMACAFEGEILTGTKCGRMDQAVAMGAGRVGLMEFDGDRCSLHDVPVGAALHFVVCDLKRGKDTGKILTDLNACFPFPQSDAHRRMHSYVHDNVARAAQAVEAIAQGDAALLAACMLGAQQSFDMCAVDNCPSQLTAPRLHEVMADAALQAVSLACKGVGSQGDGSAQVLCAGPDEQAAALARLRALGCDAFLLTIPASVP